MPDIAMCPGNGCSVRRECYRHVAPHGYRQTWMETPADAGPKCTWFMPLMRRKEMKMDNDKLTIKIAGPDGAEKWSTEVELKPSDTPEVIQQLGEVTTFFRVIVGETDESAGEG